MKRIIDRTSKKLIEICESCGITGDCRRCRRASKKRKIKEAAKRRQSLPQGMPAGNLVWNPRAFDPSSLGD